MPDLLIDTTPIQELPNAALVVLDGAIDAKTVVTFQNEMNNVREGDVSRIVLDMENVKYVNSTGLGYLINVADSLQPAGGGIALVKVQPKVRVVFDMLGLNAFFNIYGSREEAIGSFEGDGAVVTATEPEPVAEPEPLAPPVAPPAGDMAPSLVQPTSAPEPVAPVANVVDSSSISCGVCGVTLNVPDKGNYKCPRCSTVFTYIGDGKANFLPRRRTPPVQLQLNCTTESTEGLQQFVALFGRRSGLNEQAIAETRDAVGAVCGAICQQAYEGNENSVYHAMIIPSETELEIRLTDHGHSIAPQSLEMQQAEKVMDRFDHQQNTNGGNILTMSRRGDSAH